MEHESTHTEELLAELISEIGKYPAGEKNEFVDQYIAVFSARIPTLSQDQQYYEIIKELLLKDTVSRSSVHTVLTR